MARPVQTTRIPKSKATDMAAEDRANVLLNLTTEIVASYAENNSIPAAELPGLIAAVHQSLSNRGKPAAEPAPTKTAGATTARKSLSNPEHIISMVDGKPYKMLSRHVKGHGFTPKSYRETFGLPDDYPMTASAYSEKRRSLAMAIGLGKKPAPKPAPAPAAKTAAKPRSAKAALAKSKSHLGA